MLVFCFFFNGKLGHRGPASLMENSINFFFFFWNRPFPPFWHFLRNERSGWPDFFASCQTTSGTRLPTWHTLGRPENHQYWPLSPGLTRCKRNQVNQVTQSWENIKINWKHPKWSFFTTFWTFSQKWLVGLIPGNFWYKFWAPTC